MDFGCFFEGVQMRCRSWIPQHPLVAERSAVTAWLCQELPFKKCTKNAALLKCSNNPVFLCHLSISVYSLSLLSMSGFSVLEMLITHTGMNKDLKVLDSSLSSRSQILYFPNIQISFLCYLTHTSSLQFPQSFKIQTFFFLSYFYLPLPSNCESASYCRCLTSIESPLHYSVTGLK